MFTYDETLSSDRDKIRALLGDIEESAPYFTDEHIDAVYELKASDLNLSAAFLANELVARFARNPIRWTAEGVSVDMSGQLSIWQSLAQTAGSLTMVPATYGSADLPDEYARPFVHFPSYKGSTS